MERLEDRLRDVLMTEGREIVDKCNDYEDYADELLNVIMREIRRHETTNEAVEVDVGSTA